MKNWITLTVLFITLIGSGNTFASETTPAAVNGVAATEAPVFWHLGLVVSDLDTMERFYGEVIGLQRVTNLLVEDAKVSSGSEGVIVVEDLDDLIGVASTRIEIRHFSDPRHQQFLELLHYPDHPAQAVDRTSTSPLGFTHLGLSVVAIDPVLERMEKLGLGTLLTGPQTLAEFGGVRYAFLKDPEGNLVELMERGEG
jgi:catechol 2,3-dioxygenase-like lactoylglutathione lyase family enzyme